MQDTVDLLKIKIEKAKRELPLETVNAINSVDWRAAILGLRTKKGYTFGQLGDLELETELLLCGLVGPRDYPVELVNRMGISKSQANELVNEMNDLVFAKIREELIRNTERKKIFRKDTDTQISENVPPAQTKKETSILSGAGIEIVPDLPAMPRVQMVQAGKLELTTPTESREEILKKIERPELIKEPQPAPKANPMLSQKLLTSIKIPTVHTNHSLSNLTPTSAPSTGAKADPYRMPVEE